MGIRARSSRYFAAAVAGAAISLLTLPLTTRVLGPRDYGLLALGTVVAGTGIVFAALGTAFVISSRWLEANREDRRSLVSTVVLSGTMMTVGWSALVAVAYAALRVSTPSIADLPASGVALLLGATMVGMPWLVAGDVLTLEGRAGLFAATSVGQAVATAGATLTALFAFHLGNRSLFIGVFAGSLVGFAVGLGVLRPYLALRYDARWRRALDRRSFLPPALVDAAQPFLERVLLTRFAGFYDLGVYTHSQRYYAMAHAATKSVARGVWPVTLGEARDLEGDFPATRRTWNALHVAVAAVGVVLALLGDHVIALLTNGKFTDAAVFLAPWFILELLQLSAKPEVGTAYAFAPGSTVARIGLGASLAGVAATVALVPLFGAAGALGALGVQAVTYRIAVRFPTRRYRRIPFQDRWALLGIALLAIAFAAKRAVGDDLTASVAVLVALETLWLAVTWRVVAETWQALPLPRLRSTKV